ncbi:hypothetical protein BHM03_00059595 [Ensete ventricosum]|uniref:Uncharacterized protein n=1 Tax=Ensete ventricosum TaxID=4639 RepID=A0A445MMQ6_ENSVE|nr:hypothetical protein BHM03_00059595 [Ensete ventricosum]
MLTPCTYAPEPPSAGVEVLGAGPGVAVLLGLGDGDDDGDVDGVGASCGGDDGVAEGVEAGGEVAGVGAVAGGEVATGGGVAGGGVATGVGEEAGGGDDVVGGVAVVDGGIAVGEEAGDWAMQVARRAREMTRARAGAWDAIARRLPFLSLPLCVLKSCGEEALVLGSMRLKRVGKFGDNIGRRNSRERERERERTAKLGE